MINEFPANARLQNTVDNIETKVDTVDTVADSLNTNVGSDADSASASGSVHAKLKDIRKGGLSIAETNANNPTPSTWYTVLNDTSGGGQIHSINFWSQDNLISEVDFRITVDGVALLLDNYELYSASCDNTRNSGQISLGAFYDTSLKVEWRSSNASNLTTGVAVYYTPR